MSRVDEKILVEAERPTAIELGGLAREMQSRVSVSPALSD
jgi:hypothetical protein